VTLHLVSPATSSRPSKVSRSLPVRLGALALAVLFTASQIQAQGPMPRSSEETQPAPASQNQQAAAPTSTPTAGASATLANLSSIASDKMDASALPEAPSAPAEQASVNKPLDIRAMMDDAAQNTQNLQPATSEKKHQIHPGWLALSAVGAVGATIGAMGLSAKSTKGRPIAGAFVGVGAGLTGLGLYLTFK